MKRLTAINPNYPKHWGLYLCAIRARNECDSRECGACDYLGDMINKLGEFESRIEESENYNHNNNSKSKESQRKSN